MWAMRMSNSSTCTSRSACSGGSNTMRLRRSHLCRRWRPMRCGLTSTSTASNRRRRADMATDGIAAVFLETHNWGKPAKFFQGLGYRVQYATDHNSGQLRRGESPYLFIAEVPEPEPTRRHIVLGVADADAFELDTSVEIVAPWEDTHWVTRLMTVRDPDGREWKLEAPKK